MRGTLNPNKVAFSLASVSAVLSILCALFLTVAPKMAFSFLGSIFHGINLTLVAAPITIFGVMMGLFAVVLISLLAGWLFAIFYNFLERRWK